MSSGLCTLMLELGIKWPGARSIGDYEPTKKWVLVTKLGFSLRAVHSFNMYS